MKRERAVAVPGRDIALTVSLGGAAPGCVSEITGLYWFSDATAAFDTVAEAAYLLPEGGAGPTLATAKLVGETCGGEVTWATSWTPLAGSGGAPGIWSDGPDLIVYPLEDTTPGILSVSATLAGIEWGPIALVLIRYECYGYGSGSNCPTVSSIAWETGSKSVSNSGSGWSHTGTITGNFPAGTTFSWAFNWTGSPSESPTFSGSGTSCTMARASGSGFGNAYCSCRIEAPGCAAVYTEFLYVYVT
ncbi:MAG: hypothetical protein U1F59_09645 [Candidatus Competibacteraceae bacterium]